MATFRVGQRVRIVGGYRDLSFVGMQARVTVFDIRWTHETGYVDCVCVDIDGLGQHRPDGHRFAFLPEHLTPATDCYDKAEWRECAWQPPHMRETA